MPTKITVGKYLLIRLHELGIKHVFGVPGDYNLLFLDQIVNYPKIEWVGTCNELNGSYACDAYARINGMSALVTTYGVGELSAINGIAGAFAERIPVVNIVGIPSSEIMESKALMHHTTGEGKFKVFAEMHKYVTHAQTELTAKNAGAEIDRVLSQCWLRKRPVYIAIPTDVVNAEIDAPVQPLNLKYPKSNKAAVSECVERIYELLIKAKKPIVLVDAAADRYCMQDLILQFLQVTGLPFASMAMAKGLIDERHPQFMGIYCGAISTNGVQQRVEESDCIISFGQFLSDLNSGGFSTNINVSVNVRINSLYTEVQHSLYKSVTYLDLIPTLTEKLVDYRPPEKTEKTSPQQHLTATTKALTQNRFWEIVTYNLNSENSSAITSGFTMITDVGTSSFGSTFLQLPKNTKFITQILWGSIGYSVGALLGACIADPTRKAILFVGDGAFQLTAQEISTIMRHHLRPLIFLINNGGYTIERYVHAPTMGYQGIKQWNYHELPKIFDDDCVAMKITTEEQLAKAFEQWLRAEKMYFIEVVMDKMDAPNTMKIFFNT